MRALAWTLLLVATAAAGDIVLGDPRWVHGSNIHDLAYAPDGRLLVSSSDDVRVWDTATGRAVRTFGAATEVAWSPDGNWLALGRLDGTVRILEVATWREVAVLRGPKKFIDALAFGPDSTRLVVGDIDGDLRVWDATAWRALVRLDAEDVDDADTAAFAPDGTWFVTGDDDLVRTWSTPDGGARVTAKGHTSTVTDVAVAPDGTWIASSSMDHTVRVWDARTGEARHVLNEGAGYGDMWSVAIRPDGKRVVGAARDGTLTCWNPEDGTRLWRTQAHLDEANCVRYAPGGARIATAGDDGSIRFFDGETGAPVDVPVRHRLPVRAVAVTPDGGRVLSAGDDGAVMIWNARTGALVESRRPHEGREVKAVAVSPDGAFFVSGAEVIDPHTNLARWRFDAQQPRFLVGHETLIYAVAITPKRIVSTGGNWVRVWDAADGALLHTCKGHRSFTTALVAAPDGRWAASGSHDTTVRVWDLASGELLHELDGHPGRVRALAVAPDGSWLAAGSHKEITLWDPRSGARLAAIQIHEKRIWALAASKDRIYSASFDGTVRVTDVETRKEIRKIRIGGMPYALALHGDRLWVGCGDGLVYGVSPAK